MATGDHYAVTLNDGRILPIYYLGTEAQANDAFDKAFDGIRGLQLIAREQTVPKDSSRVAILTITNQLRLSDGSLITEDQKNRWFDPDLGYNIQDIYKEQQVVLDPEVIDPLGGTKTDPNEFDPLASTDEVQAKDLLSDLLEGRDNRRSFFNRVSVDPALKGGGTSTLRRGLEEAFDPIDAAFQLEALLAPRGFEWEGEGGGGADVLPRFADYAGGVPDVEAIRGQLSKLIERREMGDVEGGLSEAAGGLLENETRQRNLISAATNQRSAPGFMRNAIRTAIQKKIQRRQFEAPGADLLNQFVHSGFRL